MNEPDYGALAIRMGDAANLLEELSGLHGYHSPPNAHWSAADLRYEAEHLREGM